MEGMVEPSRWARTVVLAEGGPCALREMIKRAWRCSQSVEPPERFVLCKTLDALLLDYEIPNIETFCLATEIPCNRFRVELAMTSGQPHSSSGLLAAASNSSYVFHSFVVIPKLKDL
jgi:hypothetical protein